ncbi:3-phosphoglycerate kinase [Tanacetum coccineum]
MISTSEEISQNVQLIKRLAIVFIFSNVVFVFRWAAAIVFGSVIQKPNTSSKKDNGDSDNIMSSSKRFGFALTEVPQLLYAKGLSNRNLFQDVDKADPELNGEQAIQKAKQIISAGDIVDLELSPEQVNQEAEQIISDGDKVTYEIVDNSNFTGNQFSSNANDDINNQTYLTSMKKKDLSDSPSSKTGLTQVSENNENSGKKLQAVIGEEDKSINVNVVDEKPMRHGISSRQLKKQLKSYLLKITRIPTKMIRLIYGVMARCDVSTHLEGALNNSFIGVDNIANSSAVFTRALLTKATAKYGVKVVIGKVKCVAVEGDCMGHGLPEALNGHMYARCTKRAALTQSRCASTVLRSVAETLVGQRRSNNFVIVSVSPNDWKALLKREGFPLYQNNIDVAKPSKTNATNKLSNDGLEVFLDGSVFYKHDLQIWVKVEFDAELFYDAHKVAAKLSEGILNVKFHIGTKETMMAETFSIKCCGHVEKVYTSELLSLIITQTQDLSVGSSLVEEDKLDLATTLLAKAKGVSLLLPTDMVIADKFAPDSNNRSMIFTFYKAQDLPVGSSLVEEDKLDLAYTLLAKAKGVSLLLPRYGHC